MSNIIIRDAKSGDIEAIKELYLKCFKKEMNTDNAEQRLNSLKSDTDYKLLVCEDGDKIVGTIQCNVNSFIFIEGVLVVWGLCVDPDYRRLGVCSKLITEAEAFAKSRGCIEIYTFSSKEVTLSGLTEFYGKNGYTNNKDGHMKKL